MNVYLSEQTKEFIETAPINELEQLMFDIKDSINTREDVEEVIEMMESNDIMIRPFCKRKRPS